MSKSKIAGWVLSALIAAMMIGPSAGGKLMDFEGKEKMFADLGWSTSIMFYIGILEIACAVLFLIPKTSFIGAILLTAYLGGATATHVRIPEPFHMPVIIGVLVWIALGLRNPVIFRLALGKSPTSDKIVAE
jgi:hypothetical protein